MFWPGLQDPRSVPPGWSRCAVISCLCHPYDGRLSPLVGISVNTEQRIVARWLAHFPFSSSLLCSMTMRLKLKSLHSPRGPLFVSPYKFFSITDHPFPSVHTHTFHLCCYRSRMQMQKIFDVIPGATIGYDGKPLTITLQTRSGAIQREKKRAQNTTWDIYIYIYMYVHILRTILWMRWK